MTITAFKVGYQLACINNIGAAAFIFKTEPPINCVRNRQLRFLDHALRPPRREASKKICPLHTTLTAEEKLDVHTLCVFCLHSTFDRRQRRRASRAADDHARQKLSCMEKPCGRLLRSRYMMIIIAKSYYSH